MPVKAKMPPSLALLQAELALLAGLAIGSELPLGLIRLSLAGKIFLSLALICLVSVFIFRRHFYTPRAGTILLPLIFFGISYAGLFRLGSDPGPLPLNQPVVLAGEVVTYPRVSQRQQRLLIKTSFGERSTKILVAMDREPRLERGMQILVSGKLLAPRSGSTFDEARWLEGQGSFGSIRFPKEVAILAPQTGFWGAVTSLRARLLANLRGLLKEPVASLAAGLGLGVPPEIDPGLAEALRRANLTHLAAASGQNLVLLTLLGQLFLRPIGFYLAIPFELGLVWSYAFLVGGEASIARAAFMATLVIIAPLFGRGSEPIRLLLFAATVMSLVNPLSLTHDLGFQLSFLAFGGIVVLAPLFQPRLARLPERLAKSIATIGAATLAVFPLQVATFGTISLVGPLANLLTTGLVPYGMGGAILTGLAAIVHPVLGELISWLTYLPLQLIAWIATGLAGLPLAQLALTIPPLVANLFLIAELLILTSLAAGQLRPSAQAVSR